jgi:hypothetical protein
MDAKVTNGTTGRQINAVDVPQPPAVEAFVAQAVTDAGHPIAELCHEMRDRIAAARSVLDSVEAGVNALEAEDAEYRAKVGERTAGGLAIVKDIEGLIAKLGKIAVSIPRPGNGAAQ